jgi:hypothetical protein
MRRMSWASTSQKEKSPAAHAWAAAGCLLSAPRADTKQIPLSVTGNRVEMPRCGDVWSSRRASTSRCDLSKFLWSAMRALLYCEARIMRSLCYVDLPTHDADLSAMPHGNGMHVYRPL